MRILVIVLSLIVLPASFAGAENTHSGKIVMLWDLILKKDDNLRPDKTIGYDGLTVISPTWFSIGRNADSVSSLADREYVRLAHDDGYKVWALFENNSNSQLTHKALSDASRRNTIIEQIAGYARDYDLDGINVDFEAISRNTGDFFEDFIAELYAKLKAQNMTLSVDIPVPVSGMQKVYEINRIVTNCDYIVIMAYDEYDGSSAVIGPSAAIGWVKQGIEDALKYISCDRIILGIPFFARVWVENRDDNKFHISSELMGMKEAYDKFNQAAKIWGRDRATEQIYAEYDEDMKRYKVWLEDEHSLSLKLDAVNDYKLAGMSAWRRGLEWNEIWDLICEYFK